MHMEVLAAAFEAAADECKALAIRFIQAVLKSERGEMMSNEGSSALLNLNYALRRGPEEG